MSRETGEQNWNSIIRPALKVLATDLATGILKVMQEKRSHMAVVVSPTGDCLGIVTFVDIIGEIVGDIHDEDDAV